MATRTDRRTVARPARPAGRTLPVALLTVALLAPTLTPAVSPAAEPTAKASRASQLRFASLPKGYRQLEAIVAVVGRRIITLSELVRAQAQNTASQKLVPTKHVVRPRNARELLRQVLDTLVDNLLVTAAAKKLGLTVPDAQIDKHIKQLKDRNLWDTEELRENLRRMGFADIPAYRDHVRAEKLRVKMIRTKLGSKLRVAEAEVKRVMDLKYKGGTVEEEVRSQHILIKVPQGASPLVLNKLRQKAWRVHDLVAKKQISFTDAAEEHSDDEGTGEGGDLGWMRRWMLDPTFSKALWSLKVGEMSKVVQTPFGFHVIKLLGRREVPAKNKRVIEQMVRAQLMEQQFVKLYELWLSELRAASHVEVRI